MTSRLIRMLISDYCETDFNGTRQWNLLKKTRSICLVSSFSNEHWLVSFQVRYDRKHKQHSKMQKLVVNQYFLFYKMYYIDQTAAEFTFLAFACAFVVCENQALGHKKEFIIELVIEFRILSLKQVCFS